MSALCIKQHLGNCLVISDVLILPKRVFSDRIFPLADINWTENWKKVHPGLEKNGCHAMILPWSCHDLAMILPWWRHDGHVFWHGLHDSCHDHGIITLFSMFFFLKWRFRRCFFSNTCCHILYMIDHGCRPRT